VSRARAPDPEKQGAEGMATAAKGVFFEDLSVGQEASLSRTVTEADIAAFAEVSGDKNPVHLDAQYAAGTMFKERIAHGMLSAAYISAVFGMKLPGPGAIYISQTLNFKAPVKIGDTVVTTVKVAELVPEKKRARFECVCSVNGKPVVQGEAVLMVPARPA
jgi:3-hydroxybutyryl-CoA dehydratase